MHIDGMVIEILKPHSPEADTLEIITAVLDTVQKNLEVANISRRPLRIFITGFNGQDVKALESKGFKVQVYDPTIALAS